MTQDDPPQSAESQDSGEVLFEWTLSGEINERGDRLKVKGEPSAMMKMIQRRTEMARTQAENRIRGFLEDLCPWLFDVVTREQLEQLIHVIANLCSESARGRDDYIHEALRSVMTYLPKLQCVPDPANHPNMMKIPADSCGRESDSLDSSES